MEQIGIGIVGGIVSAAFCLLFATFWKNTILPWYEEKVYHDAKIEGKWKGTYNYGEGATEDLIILNRKGHRVWGTIRSVSGVDEGNDYYFEGTFKNLLLTGTYVASDPSKLDRGSFTLMLKENGRLFEGESSNYIDEDHKVDSVKYEWVRSSEKFNESK